METDNHTHTADEAGGKDLAALVAADRQRRIAACVQEVETTLDRYNCRLEAVAILRNGSVALRVEIVPVG